MALWHFFAGIARAILPASFIRWLRGDFKSVYGRVYDRWERIKLRVHRLKGGKYIDWYAKRMDGFAAKPKLDPAIKREYHDSGVDDLETLKLLGLKPTDKLHEFGCGFLRSAHFFIKYLEPGNFSANDSAGERIRNGLEYMKKTYDFDLMEKNPELIVNEDNSFDWLDRKPDIIWCHAVFTHMPDEDIDDFFGNLKKVMKPETAFYFTYSEKAGQRHDIEHMGVKDWWHKQGYFNDLAARHGFEIEHMTEFLQGRECYRPEHHLSKLTLAQPASDASAFPHD